MTAFIINPGSGPIARNPKRPRSVASATANMRALLRDCGIPKARFKLIGKAVDPWDGRYTFEVRLGRLTCSVDMPAIRLDAVRWMDLPGQDIWQFPRLYVDGNSWVWKYAVGALCNGLGVEEP